MSISGAQTLAVVIAQGQASAAQMQHAMDAANAIVVQAGFARIDVIPVKDGTEAAQQRNLGIDRAKELRAPWILFVEPDEQVHPQALMFLAPALDSYDALWGGMALDDGHGSLVIAKQSQISSSDTVRNFHMALHWWVGKSHFVRTDVADQVRCDVSQGDAWYADYLVRLWDKGRCLKSAQPLTSGRDLPSLTPEERAFLLDNLRRNPRRISFTYQSHQIHFAYTGRNPTLERVQLRGLFYEQSDLERLSTYVKPGAVCVDVGANTGNHTVFFEKVLGASKVIPIEPNPDCIAVLNQVFAWNGLTQVDPSKLGFGVGREAGQFSLQVGRRGYLGTAHLTPGGAGSVSVRPLDSLIDDDEDVDFLKIDVERMEVAVLDGARGVIARCQPVLLIEAQDENIMTSLAILENLGYRIEHVFPDQGYANYLALPTQKA